MPLIFFDILSDTGSFSSSLLSANRFLTPVPICTYFLEYLVKMSTTFITEWAKGQQPKAQALKEASVFYRNLEEELDVRRSQHAYVPLHTSDLNIDLASHDSLALDSSGTMRTAFLDELAQYPDFRVGSRGSRVASGNSSFFEQVEQEIADFHGAEAALILENGCLCNGVIFSTIPRPGDAIVYDELVHASIHDGMKDSLALCQKSFRHNNVDSFIDTLQSIRDSQPLIDNGSRTVLVAVESFYSMDGDVCPLQELVEAAREVLPDGNAQFIIDEAQSTGVIGPNGAGLVCALGLENEVAIKLHTFSKALAAFGGEATSSRIYADIDAGCKLMLTLAAILCSKTVKATLLNFARSITFSQAPTFPMLAAIRSAYKLQRSPQAQQVLPNPSRLLDQNSKHLMTRARLGTEYNMW